MVESEDESNANQSDSNDNDNNSSQYFNQQNPDLPIESQHKFNLAKVQEALGAPSLSVNNQNNANKDGGKASA